MLAGASTIENQSKLTVSDSLYHVSFQKHQLFDVFSKQTCSFVLSYQVTVLMHCLQQHTGTDQSAESRFMR